MKQKIVCAALACCLAGVNTHTKMSKGSQKGLKMPIRAAVIPAAGLGTRFLPFTKSVPKEMLPLINKPAIQHIVEESVDSHLTELFIIIGNGKGAIVDYFNPIHEQAAFLKEKDRQLLQEVIAARIARSTISYLLQPQPRGLGNAIYMARNVITPDSYFAVLLPDDILVGSHPAIGSMAHIAQKEGATIIAVQEVPQENISSYGVISIKNQLSPDIFEVDRLVEKPKTEDAPSNLAIVGRYILPQKLFAILERTPADAKGEIQLTDAIQQLIQQGEKVLAYKLPHKRFDTGTPRGWLEAIIHFGMNDPNYADEIKTLLKV